jgi:glucosamine--fructose-6-phosphate aminotransferase (isomerizing)
MLKEAVSAAECVSLQLSKDAERYAELGRKLRSTNFNSALTVARGSSDHAANYCAYLIMARMGRIVASLPMSLVTLYKSPLVTRDTLTIAISQSGQSPDVVEPIRYFRDGGATTVALVNDIDSPLAHAAEWAMPLHAGQEQSVAATKSFVLSMTAVTHLVAEWARDAALLGALHDLPDALGPCDSVDWSAAMRALSEHDDVFVIGRGPSLPVAHELALKLKEVCGMHAEALSAAELLHGPISIASPALAAMVLAGDEATRETVNAAVAHLRAAGAPVVILGTARNAPAHGADVVVIPAAPDPVLQPVVAAQAAYAFFAQLARARGRDPDSPPQLEKITRTR